MGGRLVRRVRLEQLESRQLLAIDVTPEGILNVTGTNKSDRIDLVLSASDIQVTVNKQSETVPLAGLTGINIAGIRGNDWITVDAAITLAATISGGDGNDRLTGGGGNDTINGGKGNDRSDGRAGDDSLFGELGNDRLTGGIGNDLMNGGSGNDWLIGWDGNDVLIGEAGVDHIYGNAGDDEAHGGDKNDKIFGGPGLDVLYGGGGNDIVAGNEDNDQLFGDSGKDKLYGGAGDDELHGGWGGDMLNGGEGNDLLDGDEGIDREIDGTSVNLDVELLALLSSPTGVSGQAEFSYEADDLDGAELELEIEIDGAVPLTTLDVKLDGTSIGSIAVDAAGHGRLKLSSDPDSEGDTELEFPQDFSIHAGSTILIGLDITGTFGPAPI
jgi:Ca2+-binding RTX toxin-like protein